MSYRGPVAESAGSPGRINSLNDPLGRCIDVAGALFGLVALSPILLAIAAGVRRSSPGPVLFRTTRVGRHGRGFTLFKFRTMRQGAETAGPAITAAGDPRITEFGAILRRFKLDELPQLINVLKGDMSLVGPRPEDPRYVAMYTRAQLAVLDRRPGMTSPASVRYSDEESTLVGDDWNDRYIEEVMPAKLAIELDYHQHRTPLTDLGIILSTFAKLIGRHS